MTELYSQNSIRPWLSAAELARLALPGLPTTVRGVQSLACRRKWLSSPSSSRERVGTGGALEYHCRALPEPALAALSVYAVSAARLAPWDETPHKPVTGGDARLKAKLAVLTAYDAFAAIYADGRSETRGRHRFAELYKLGEIPVPPQVRALVKSISASSLERWSAARTDHRLDELAGRYGNRRGRSPWDSELAPVRDALFTMISHHPEWSVNRCRHQLRVRFGDPAEVPRGEGGAARIKLPSLRSMQMRVRAWTAEGRLQRHAGTDTVVPLPGPREPQSRLPTPLAAPVVGEHARLFTLRLVASRGDS